MNDDRKKGLAWRLRKMQCEQVRVVDQEFSDRELPIRQWYLSQSIEKRQELKQDLRTLAALRFKLKSEWQLEVGELAFELTDEHGNVAFSIGAKQEETWLDGLEMWDETADDSQMPLE